MKALYLESIGQLSIRDYQEEMVLGDDDVEVEIKRVGICGSDGYSSTGIVCKLNFELPQVT